MNRLIRCVISFVLPFFCLLISVSYGAFSTTPLGQNTSGSNTGSSSSASTLGESGYNTFQVQTIIYNYYSDISNSANSSAFTDMMNSLYSSGYGVTIVKQQANSNYQYAYVYNYSDTDIGYLTSNRSLACTLQSSEYTNRFLYKLTCTGTTSESHNYEKMSDTYGRGLFQTDGDPSSILYSTIPLKLLTWSSGYKWDGTSYYYEPPLPEEPDTPSLPSNAEIAQAVQAFYNSIYNQPNIAFDDFIVLYDTTKNLYSYIGHTRSNAIGQVIVEPNGYYNGYKFDVQWWQFYLDEQNDGWDWTNITKYNNYYLYTSQGDIDTLEFVGQDKIDNLFSAGPWATSNTIIVYSTNDYPVKYITFSDESPDPVVEEGTIKGDQYTYDENLDITDNQYNPLDNFVTIDPTITIIGNVDFDEINKVFEENKNILIIENANWLFSANNQLFNYFSGFILFLIVLIIISRLLGG